MKTLALLTLVLASAGCSTLSNINKMNRVMPQIEHLVMLKDKVADGEAQSITLCGVNDYEERLLIAVAKQMGYEFVAKIANINREPSYCTRMVCKPGP